MNEADATMGMVRLIMGFGSFCLALIGGVVFRDRQVAKRISDGNAAVHKRVDDMKDDINENFARKDDMKESIRRVERSIEGLGQELRQNHKDLIAHIVKKES